MSACRCWRNSPGTKRWQVILTALLFSGGAGQALADSGADAAVVDAAAAGPVEPEEVNTGQDITKPLTRVDVRASYQLTPSERNSSTFILRSDKPFVLGDGWTLALRADAPTSYNNIPSSSNPTGAYGWGFSDALAQVLLIKTLDKREAFGFGTQVIVPTATADQFGNQSLRLVPTAGYRYSLPEISPGSFFVFAARYDFDVEGPSTRKPISNYQFSPTLNIALPDKMFLTFYPSTDIRYNVIAQSWFVPLDLMIGKLWNKTIVTSLEYSVPLYRGTAPLYNYKLEARVGFFF
jgi:hypothetical protein